MARDRLEIIDGDHQLDPAVKLVKIGGHTPGSMVVMVSSAGLSLDVTRVGDQPGDQHVAEDHTEFGGDPVPAVVVPYGTKPFREASER